MKKRVGVSSVILVSTGYDALFSNKITLERDAQ